MNRHPLRICALVMLTAVSVNSLAETPPPHTPFDAITWKATMKRKPSTGAKMGSFSVRFEKTTLDDVRKAASAGTISHHGDANESIYWLCYTNVTPIQTEKIWIISHGEMGGPEHFVTNISAELLANERATADCPALPEKLKPMVLDSHLWLNASASGVRAKLGNPSYQKGPWRSFDYQGKLRGDCEGGGFDVVNWLLLRFEKGRVNSLYVGQITSC